jgi:hypothetical protein
MPAVVAEAQEHQVDGVLVGRAANALEDLAVVKVRDRRVVVEYQPDARLDGRGLLLVVLRMDERAPALRAVEHARRHQFL